MDSDRAPESAGSSPLHAIVGLGGIQVLSALAGIVRAKVLAVIVGVAGFGVIAVVDSAVAFVAQLGSFSIPMAATRFLPTRRAEGEEAFVALYRALAKTLVISSLIVSIVASAIAFWRPTLFGDELSEYRVVVLLALLSVPAAAFAPFLRSVMALVGKHRQAAMSVFLTGVGFVLSSWVGLRLGGLPGLYLANVVVAVAAVVLMRGQLRDNIPSEPVQPARTVEALRREKGLVAFCTGMHLLTLAAPLAYLYARLSVFSLHGEEAVGLLAAAYGIAIAVRVVLNQGNALYLAPLVNQPTTKAVRAVATANYLHTLTVLLVVGSLAVVLFPREVILVLYSSQFTAAASLVGAFLIGESIMLASAVLQALLIGFGDLRSQLSNTVAGQLVVVVFVYVLVPSRGVIGAAFAFIIGHSVILALTALRLVRGHETTVIARALPLLIAGIGALGTISWWVVAVSPAVGWKVLAYVLVGGAFIASLRPDERRRLLAPWRAFTGG